jgi:hypothetical protein
MNSPDERARNPTGQGMIEEDAIIDLRDIFIRLSRGLGQILGLALLGTVIAVVGYLITRPWQPISTSTRVAFSFPGFEKGEYPDHSKFQPDDLRGPEIIAEALKRQGLNTSDEFQSQIRGALGIEGFIPPKSANDYVPDVYIVTLTLPEKFPISKDQRVRLLNEIINVYHENFQRTYTSTLAAFGHVFEVLPKADFPEYQQIFNREIGNITDYLTQQLEQGKSFRSPTTNLSFQDLLDQTQLFVQNRLSEPLELIYQGGFSRNRTLAIAKMEYSVRMLDEQEHHAAADQKVFTDLLTQPQARHYVLDAKPQADLPYSEIHLADQASAPLLANDTGSLLVLHAIKVGLRVSQLQADKAQLLEQLEALKSAKENAGDTSQVQKLLAELEPTYQELIDNIHKTQTDFARQQFADAIRISAAVTTTNRMSRMLALTGAAGCFIGLAAGMGLSLLGIYIGSAKKN